MRRRKSSGIKNETPLVHEERIKGVAADAEGRSRVISQKDVENKKEKKRNTRTHAFKCKYVFRHSFSTTLTKPRDFQDLDIVYEEVDPLLSVGGEKSVPSNFLDPLVNGKSVK